MKGRTDDEMRKVWADDLAWIRGGPGRTRRYPPRAYRRCSLCGNWFHRGYQFNAHRRKIVAVDRRWA